MEALDKSVMGVGVGIRVDVVSCGMFYCLSFAVLLEGMGVGVGVRVGVGAGVGVEAKWNKADTGTR